MGKDDLRHVGRLTDEVDVAEGEELLREGQFAYEFMVIEDGRAEVQRASGEPVAELGQATSSVRSQRLRPVGGTPQSSLGHR
ncbi:MAG: hypothetical protein AVDCRST_MAG67-1777 [uncultured Solirubrobacteraceae bacterium]|uniref:Cyclic nucleotide-binding domain-containing protein n=1 Tax=uncultured Solirubrobacteraceae bacterium TaxID=1162706 RepID=A0A6J4SET7_9ACTN|nr:MAG: hypothetical protein AVDCRST_MAG67-1777 [uncultured Solirubrobacteraceae bacterium]